MSRPPKYLDEPNDRRRFEAHIQDWLLVKDIYTVETYFSSLPEDERLCSSALFATLKRYKIKLPTNRNLPRKEILERQRTDRVPIDVIAWRYGIKESTLRSWSRQFDKPLLGNTPVARREWWAKHFMAMNLPEAFAYFDEHHLPPHIAIPMWHVLNAPDHPVAWLHGGGAEYDPFDEGIGLPGNVITTWTLDMYHDNLAALPPDDCHAPKSFLGLRIETRPILWEDITL